MEAIQYYGPGDVRCVQVERPSFGPREVLIKVSYAGICGSDLHIYRKGMFIQNIPETMGHEFTGVIQEVGSQVTGLAPGDVVIADPMVPCMACGSCRRGSYNTCEALGFIGEVRPGCFAEYIALDQDVVLKVPAAGDQKLLALAEPLAVALNICRRARFQPEDRVALIGAGPIGLLTVLAAKALCGVTHITVADLSQARLALARRVGASSVCQRLPEGQKFSKVIDAAGQSATLNAAVSHTEANGFTYVVSIFEDGVSLDINALVSAQITLVGCNVYTREDLARAAQVISDGTVDVEPLISQVLPLSQGAEAFRILASREKGAAKILLRA